MSLLNRLNIAVDNFIKDISFSVDDESYENTKQYKQFKKSFNKAFNEQLTRAIKDGLVKDVNEKLGKSEIVEELEPVSPAQVDQIFEGVDEAISPLSNFVSPALILAYFTFTANKSGKKTLKNLGVSLTFNLTNESIIASYQNRVDLLIETVDNTTKKFLTREISKGLDQGLSTGEMVDVIRDQYPEIIENRAEMIVRTETQNIIGDIDLTVARNNGSEEKKWLTAKDDRVRPEHVANGEQGWLPINDNFQSGHFRTPGGVNCRCSTIYKKPLANKVFWSGE